MERRRRKGNRENMLWGGDSVTSLTKYAHKNHIQEMALTRYDHILSMKSMKRPICIFLAVRPQKITCGISH